MRPQLLLPALLLMTCPATSLPIYPPLPPTAEEAAKVKVVASTGRPETWRGGTSSTLSAPGSSSPSIQWRHDRAGVLQCKDIPQDWTGAWNTLDFWIHSHHPVKSSCILIISSANPKTEGMDYYSLTISLNFQGWKHITVPLKDLTVSRSPLGWKHIDGLRFHGDGWGLVPDKTAVVTVSSLRLVYVKPLRGPRTSDEALFQALNLDLPGLEKVSRAIQAGDVVIAKKELASYFRHRTGVIFKLNPQDLFSPASRNADYNTFKADKIARNRLTSCAIEHDFGEHIDWSINPTKLKYSEWTWQLSRHHFWQELGRAYWATGNETYARAFVRQLRSWIIQNPHPKHAANGVGSRWRTIEAGIRMFSSWPEAFHRFLLSPSFDDDSLIMMLKSFCEHARYLKAFPTRNNWLAMEMNGLYHVGVLFPEFKEANAWRETAASRLYEELNIQVYPDGAQKELATGYHGISLENFLGIFKLAQLNRQPLPKDYVSRLEKMFQMYLNVMTPTGYFPPFNDSGWGNARRWLQQGATLFPQRTDFLYAATDGTQGTLPKNTSNFMPYAGWATMRSGWQKDDLYACFEVGPFGAGHQHEDKLSFVLQAYGKRLLTEGGIYPYDRSQWRKYVLAARAHNVVRVDGLDQNRRGRAAFYLQDKPLDNTWITQDDFDLAEGVYDEGFGPQGALKVTHARTLVFLKSTNHHLTPYWLVIDVMTPQDHKPHAYDTWFHVNTPRAHLIPELNAAVTDDADAPNLLIASLTAPAQSLRLVTGQEHPEVQGWLPVKDYDVTPVATPTFTRKAAGQAVQVYALIPLAMGNRPPIRTVRHHGNSVIITFADGAHDSLEIIPSPCGKLKKLTITRHNSENTVLASLKAKTCKNHED